MAAYVYKYVHPEKGCIYVGRTKNLANRIASHDNNKDDNIARDFEKLLHESDVYYCEVANTAESIIVETYLINALKPELNDALKFDGVTSSIQVTVPEFVVMDNDHRHRREIISKRSTQKKQEKRQYSTAYWKTKADKTLSQWGGKRVPDEMALYVDLVSRLNTRCSMLYNHLVDVAYAQHDGFQRTYKNGFHVRVAQLCELYGFDIYDPKQLDAFGEILREDLLMLSQRHWYAIGDDATIGTYGLLDASIYKPYLKNDIVDFYFDERNVACMVEVMNAKSAQP